MDIDKTQLNAPQWYLDKLNMQIKAREIFDLKKQKATIDKQLEDLKKQNLEIDKNITDLEASLLSLMKYMQFRLYIIDQFERKYWIHK